MVTDIDERGVTVTVGRPRGSFVATVTWPPVSDGAHQILAVEAALTATASVWSTGTAE